VSRFSNRLKIYGGKKGSPPPHSRLDITEPKNEDNPFIVLPVPPKVLHTRNGEALARFIMEIMVSGESCGPYGGRVLVHFKPHPTLEFWERPEVRETCKRAVESCPEILDAMVWEDHPDLVVEEPDEAVRTDTLHGRLKFVSWADSDVWNPKGRDLEANRQKLEQWQELAKKSRS